LCAETYHVEIPYEPSYRHSNEIELIIQGLTMKFPLAGIFFLCFLSIFSLAQDMEKLNIAMNDLQGKGVEQSAAAIISDRLRSELLGTGIFRVMERKEMTAVLKEQGFQQSGACTEASCIVEVGQLLGVKRMIAGTI